jgi:hypothetical protein
VVLVVVLLAASAWVIGRQFGSSKHAPKHSSIASIRMTEFKDPGGTFDGGYPSSWKRLKTSDPQVVLLAAGPNGTSYEVAKTPIGVVINATNLTAAEKLTNHIVDGGKDVKLIPTRYKQPEEVALGGLPGLLYLYTFLDPTTGEHGAHAHYFLFDGKTMITLVFQSLPSNTFTSQAPLFDRIAGTFHALQG